MRKQFHEHAASAASCASGALLPHVFCCGIIPMALASGSSVVAGVNLEEAALVVSPAVGASITAIADRVTNTPQSVQRIARNAALSFAIAVGVHAVDSTGHNHNHDDCDHPTHQRAVVSGSPKQSHRYHP